MSKIALSWEPLDGPTTQGRPTVLTVRVDNSSDGLLLLDRAWADGIRHQPVEWLDRALGCAVYDAGQDVYRLLRAIPTRSQVPLAKHLVVPGGGCDAFLRLEPLETTTATLHVRGWLIPSEEAEARIYGTPDLHSRRVVFRRGLSHEEAASLVVRTDGLEAVEAEASVELSVTPDPAASAALERAGPGARLLLRSRRVPAWILAAGGETHLVEGERHAHYEATILDPGVFPFLEEAHPSEPVLVLFKGEAANALRDSGDVPLEGDKGQRILRPANLWELLAAAAARGLHVAADRHSVMAGRGLTVSSG